MQSQAYTPSVQNRYSARHGFDYGNAAEVNNIIILRHVMSERLNSWPLIERNR